MKLRISDDLSLPLDAVTQTFGIYGIRGSGKTHTAVVMVEEILKAGQPVCVYDPVGAWYGLKSSSDGKKAGFPVVVFGGEHADIPLTEHAGETVARAIVEGRIPAILDVSLMRKAERIRFMTVFCESLYHLNREPLHFVVDEAHTVAPLRPLPESARLLGAMEDIILQGRLRGLGLTTISQRPALMHTNIRTQSATLIAMRIIGPHDLKAIQEWTDAHGSAAQSKELMDSLPTIKTGNGWVWSPSWLEVFKRVKFRQRETFDSSATPEVGRTAVGPKIFAKIDIAALGDEIASAVKAAADNDPKKLKADLSKARADLAKAQQSKPAPPAPAQIKEVPVLKNGQLDRTHKVIDRLQAIADRCLGEVTELRKLITPAFAAKPAISAAPIRTMPAAAVTRIQTPKKAPVAVGDLVITKTQQRILDAIAWYESTGRPAPTLIQIGAVAMIDPTGGHFSNTVGPLSTAGLIDRADGSISLTAAGREVATIPESVGTLSEYHEVLRGRIRKMKSASGKTVEILNAIIAGGGAPMDTQAIGEAVSIDHTGGHFSNSIGPLSTAGLIKRKDGVVTPTDVLFPPALAG